MTSAPTRSAASVRHRIRVRGLVQGVGFRPFVRRLAGELRLDGHVGNDTDGVFVEVEGASAAIDEFELRLRRDAPPLARIDTIDAIRIASTRSEAGFRIVESRSDSRAHTFVAPDAAVCDECLRELADPDDRRYRYPFITCTNCGPRFTITVRLPYDRPNTTMAEFALCPPCAAEYDDPADRRFHAQPLACPQCGPRVWFETTDRQIDGTDDALAAAQRALATGGIVAVKGLGGYHLACTATADEPVRRLRNRKGRVDKPFAVMARDLAVAERLAEIDGDEARLLTSPARPIVLLAARPGSPLSSLVAPGNPFIGVMLPYTPMHHLLFAPVPLAEPAGSPPELLVLTSGNLTDEPICFDDDDARRRLARIADAWLAHDRPIHVPCDDSVLRMVDGDVLPVRRSRGYVPFPVRLPRTVVPTLAVGGELKNTFCLAAGRDAWMSQHIGDMGSVETLVAFERSVDQFRDMYEIDPRRIVADAHPGYQTRRWAETRRLDDTRAGNGSGAVALVQHHHAHVLAVMAEHEIPADEEVIGCAYDGTGYGDDGAIWGGEVLRCRYDDFDRLGHLRYVPLPGGDTTIRKPYRSALAHLWAARVPWDAHLAPVRAAVPAELAVLERQIERDVHCVPTSSMGRLFDAVSSLLDVRHQVSYEAQAAIELEALAREHLDAAAAYRFGLDETEIDAAPVIRAIAADVGSGRPTGPIAAGFHVAVARMTADVVTRTVAQSRPRVALTGGVFQNVLLLRLTRAELSARGFEVLTHRAVPPNDGGLALGQVVAGAGAFDGSLRAPR